MELSRRQLLAAGGVAGAGILGTGYWQRRRLIRVPAISELHDVVAIEVPQIETDPVITMPLLESAYNRAVDRFDEIEPRIDQAADQPANAHVETLQEQLAEMAPERVSVWPHGPPAIHYARRQALFTYRRTRSRAVSILASESPADLSPDVFEERSSAVREQLASITVPYRGATLGEAIISGGLIESSINRAESRFEDALAENDSPDQWENLERAMAAVEDVHSFINARDGDGFEAYGTELPTLADRLVTEYEQRQADAPDPLIEGGSDDDEPISSFANSAIGTLQQSMRDLGAAHYVRRGLLEDGAYGRAAHIHALLLPTVPLYEAFADVPRVPYWDDFGYERAATPEELRAEKTATIDAVEPYLAADDPVVTHLAAVPLGVVRRADGYLQTLIEEARTLTDADWARWRDQAVLQYEGARRYAESIPETLEIMTDGTESS